MEDPATSSMRAESTAPESVFSEGAEAAPALAEPAPAAAPEAEHARCPRCRAKIKSDGSSCPLCGYEFGDGGAEPARAEDVAAIVQAPLPDDAVGYLISVSSVDGRETTKLPLRPGVNTLGRGADVDLRFPEDDLLSPVHLKVEVEGKVARLLEPGSRNGTFLRATEQVKLANGALFRVGQQLLRFEDLESLENVVPDPGDGTQVLGSPAGARTWGRLAQVVSEELAGSCFLLTSENVFLGRERGNITFPGDRYISGTHAVITRKADGPYLRDVGSSNGTYVQLHGEVEIQTGQYFLAGRQLFKLYLGN